MENKIHSVSVVEQCVVTPASVPTDDIHAPLTFLDMQWMYFNNIQRLVFYKIPNLSRSQFLGHIFPNLRQSLSLALDHFPLVAGNLIIPPSTNSSMPEIFFTNGDGVTLICAECDNMDFNHLVRTDERDCDMFHSLVPELKASSSNKVISTSPVLALQITLFPGAGLSVGISNHHALGDATSMFMFMKTWSIYNFKLSHGKIVSEQQLVLDQVSVFDRNLIQDNKGISKIICDQWMNLVSNSQGNPFFEAIEKPRKVRKTFLISSEDVKKLKNLVSNKVHISSFVVIYSYIWMCLVKSRSSARKRKGDQREHLTFSADCRERTDPHIPANYFGNCLTPLLITLNGTELTEEGGFLRASELLGKTINEKLRQRDAVFGGEEDNLEIYSKLNWPCSLSLAGSTRQNYYTLDFGWGTALKFEFISINSNGAVSLSGCRDSDGGAEVGLALTVPQMKDFTSIFTAGLNL